MIYLPSDTKQPLNWNLAPDVQKLDSVILQVPLVGTIHWINYYPLCNSIDGFQSRDKAAMLVHKAVANLVPVLQNNRVKFPRDFFSLLFCAPTNAAMTSGENHQYDLIVLIQ